MQRCMTCNDNIRSTGELDQLPKAMAYVPWQRFERSIELGQALKVGTIFPELYKPFGGRRCPK